MAGMFATRQQQQQQQQQMQQHQQMPMMQTARQVSSSSSHHHHHQQQQQQQQMTGTFPLSSRPAPLPSSSSTEFFRSLQNDLLSNPGDMPPLPFGDDHELFGGVGDVLDAELSLLGICQVGEKKKKKKKEQ